MGQGGWHDPPHHRFVISDGLLWQRITPLLPRKATDQGVTARDNRPFLEAVFWRMRTGAPWRDLLPGWGTQPQFSPLAPELSLSPGGQQRYLLLLLGPVDKRGCPGGGVVVGHKDGGTGGRAGHSLCFLLLPGQTHHSRRGAPLSNKAPFDVLLAGKAFDNDWLLTALDARGAIAVIPQGPAVNTRGPTTRKPTRGAT